MGLICPVGVGTDATWKALQAGESGIAPITFFDTQNYRCHIAGEVKNFQPDAYMHKKEVQRTGRFIHFALAAAQMALEQAQLPLPLTEPDRTGVYLGSGIGGFEVIERERDRLRDAGPNRVSPFFIPASIVNLAAGQVAIRTNARGPNLACATACTTGAHAVGEAFRIVQHGDADVMICGGTEAAITPLSIAGFDSMKALSTRNDDPATASRPWDAGRDGFIAGEGGGVLILEEREHALQRGVTILAELVGYGRNGDAYHIAAPREDGDGIAKVMQLALRDAGLEPNAIDYLNAHATSTQPGDRAEALAIQRIFGEHVARLAVSSTKSMTGHLLGGAGSLEAGITVLALRDQVAPPTINLHEPDYVGLDFIPNQARRMTMRYAMTNSFGFGGTNASLIFRTAEE